MALGGPRGDPLSLLGYAEFLLGRVRTGSSRVLGGYPIDTASVAASASADWRRLLCGLYIDI